MTIAIANATVHSAPRTRHEWRPPRRSAVVADTNSLICVMAFSLSLVDRGLCLHRNRAGSERIDRPYVERQRAAVCREINLVAAVAEKLDPSRLRNGVLRSGVRECRARRTDEAVRHRSGMAGHFGSYRCVVEKSGQRDCVQNVHGWPLVQGRYHARLLLESVT